MTEEEWLNDNDPHPRQLLVVQRYASLRKVRLIAAVLVRYLQERQEHEEVKCCDDLIELCADEPRPWDHWETELQMRPGNWRFTHLLFPLEQERPHDQNHVVQGLRKLVAFNHYDPPSYPLSVIHEVVANPFRPAAFDPAWRTSDVMLLANGIYAEKAFDRMPILADALQDAGCDSADILNHLRDMQAPHVRGCWALDLVLGKE